MKRINYRHYICIAITLGFLACSVFVFPHALGRIIECFRDLGLSVAYYFCELCDIPHGITPTVNDLPKYPFFEFLNGYESASTTLPGTWTGFQEKWGEYWQLWATEENFLGYLNGIGEGLAEFSRWFLLIGVPVIVVLIIMFKSYLMKFNNSYDEDTKQLRAFKKISDYTYRPVKKWLIGFFEFVKERKKYWLLWLFIWAWNFNFITILIEFFANYFYFVVSFDFVSLYIQVYKLALDLWAVLDFVPVWVWVLVGYFVLNAISFKMAYDRLNHRERCNRGFLNERGTVRIVDGVMGAGKTAFLTDASLSDEVQLLSDAYEIIIETDMHFPYFPWINLENWLKKLIRLHVIYDVPSCRRLIRSKFKRWKRTNRAEDIFKYDYDRYGMTYNDNLKLTYLWEALEDYACAYFIYTVQSSYMISNYSIRSDKLMADMGNFPLWNTDFFKRDSRLLESFSRHSHILDQDMLRIGTKMLKDNPNRYAFGFGVYVISEIDKERKNSLELKEVKKDEKDPETGEIVCNQKNDMLSVTLKMSRHACVIANRVFDRFNCDLQRTGDLSAGIVELGEVLHISEKGDLSPVLPFFSPFWIIELIYLFFKRKFDNFYAQYRFNRSDNTLFMYLYKGIISKLSHYCERISNLFGAQTLKVEVEDSRGRIKKCKWYRMPKKVFSDRYCTDGHAAIFELRAELNMIGIEDLKEYAGKRATYYEMGLQNSHFWNDILKYNSI